MVLCYWRGAARSGLGYGFLRYATRDKSKDRITEAATREMHDHQQRYKRTRQVFERAAKED
jgi:hypothetical protein